jgi:hypothetical protein
LLLRTLCLLLFWLHAKFRAELIMINMIRLQSCCTCYFQALCVAASSSWWCCWIAAGVNKLAATVAAADVTC